MTAVLIGLMLSVLAAVGVMIAVALPSLRQGDRFLSPEGERLAREAAERARLAAAAAAERVGEVVSESAASVRESRPISKARIPLPTSLPGQGQEPVLGPRHARARASWPDRD